MTAMASSDAAAALRVRAGAPGDAGGPAKGQTPGVLAGRFAAMLEQLNGVAEGASGTAATDGLSGGGQAGSTAVGGGEIRVGHGAVALFAQDADGSALGSTPTAAEAAGGQVDGSEMPHDARWLAMLLAQDGSQGARR